jgi:hypothetical protein
MPVVGGRPTFARNSGALFRDQQYVLTNAIPNTPRLGWTSIAGERRQVLMLEPATTNSALQSSDFGTTWTLTNVTVSANAVIAPDGTLTADKLAETNANASHAASQTVSMTASTAQALSVYAKAAERNWICLQMVLKDGSGVRVWFNLATGTIGTQSGATGTIEALGDPYNNGWYRCSISVASALTGASATSFAVRLADADNSQIYLGVTGNGAYFWGAQFEQDRKFITSLVSTTTASVSRVADSLYYTYPVAPLASYLYVRFEERGAAGTSGPMIQTGDDANGNNRLVINSTGGKYRAIYNATQSSTLATAPNVGDYVELLVKHAADGSVQLHQLINGVTLESAAASGTVAFPTTWAGNYLQVGENTSGSATTVPHSIAEIKIVALADVVSTAIADIFTEIRAFELSPAGVVL